MSDNDRLVERGCGGREGFPNGVLGLRQEINGAGELGLEPKGFKAGRRTVFQGTLDETNHAK